MSDLTSNSVFYRILLSLVNNLNIPTNKFNMTDPNTFYFVNGKKINSSEKDVCKLGYRLPSNMCKLSPEDILKDSLKTVSDSILFRQTHILECTTLNDQFSNRLPNS